jgi:nucleotide-binding universal stress UspA family protein
MYKKILVAVDDSETSRCALVEAASIARASNAKLYIVNVADEALLSMHQGTVNATLNLDHAMAAIRSAGEEILAQAKSSLTGVDVETLQLETTRRRVSEILVDKAKELGCELIVIGRHGQRGLARLILGSVAEQVSKLSDASVLLVRKH